MVDTTPLLPQHPACGLRYGFTDALHLPRTLVGGRYLRHYLLPLWTYEHPACRFEQSG